MDRDCLPYLTVGTDVSAKYRGAFCEAKVKTTTKHVKCKINFKGLPSAVVSDEFVNGTLKIGATVSARHPDQGTYIEGVITKLTDASTYTVVFDDGDEKTLRRSSLCLQGERHFNESETLDHLPLTDPENFGTPVVRDAKKRKKRKPVDSDDEQMNTGISPNVRKRISNTGKEKILEDIGKVVIVDVNEKRKNSWFPALVIHPKRSKEVSLKNKDIFILKSFKDNKVHNIPKSSTKPFTTKDHVYKGDNNSLKAAVSKAVSYIETGNLPHNWDNNVIVEEDFLFESDDEVDSDDESDEDFDVETDAWLASLYKFMEERGTPINKPPVLGYQDLNLFKLYKLVQDLGGCRKVTDHQKWREISFKMGIPVINSSNHHNIKASYIKYLHAFEEYNRKLGPGLPGPLTRTKKRRSSYDRPTLSPIRPRVTRNMEEDGESDTEREPPMLKRRGTLTELEEIDEKPFKKSERQNKKDDKQKKDVKKDESDKEDEIEEKNIKAKGNEQKADSKVKSKSDTKHHAEADQSNDNQSNETDTDYQLGEKIKVLYGRGRTQKVYEAKIIEIDVEAHWQKMYRVHYVGWNIRHDEWIGNNRIVGSDDRVKLRKKQKMDKEKEREKKLREKEKKEKEEKERLQREEKERIQKEHEKLLKDKKEKERLEKEKEKLEKERIKKEKEKLEKEKKEKLEKEIREKERLEKEQKRKEKEKAEQERKEKEEREMAESLENKKKEKKEEKVKGKGKSAGRTKEDQEVVNMEKEDQIEKIEVERPKTPGKRGRPSLKSNTTPTAARSNSVTRKAPSPVLTKQTKSTRTRRSDRNSLSESPFAAGLDVKPRTRRTSITSDSKVKQEDDSESEKSTKDEDEKAEEIKGAEDDKEQTQIKEKEEIKMEVGEIQEEKEQMTAKEVEDKQMEETVKEKEEIKTEPVPIVEVPHVEDEVPMEQKQVEEVAESMTPKGKEKKKDKKEGKSKKRKEGKGKKDKKDQIGEQSEENATNTAVLESNSLECTEKEDVNKAVVYKVENEEESPKKDYKSEGKKSRKRKRSKSSSDRKSKETADKDESGEFKKLSSRFKEEEGAAALLDIYNPRAAAQEKLESMAQTSKSLTPPTTPENSPPNPSSPAEQSVNELQQDEPNRSDSDGLIDVAGVTDVQPIGSRSPHCDASISSNTSADSMNGSQEKRSGTSKKRRRTTSECDTPGKRKRRSHKHSSNHHDKKKRHSKEPIRHSSSDTDDTSNNDVKAGSEKLIPTKTPEQNGNGKPTPNRSGRTPKYDFRVDLTNVHDPEERIAIIQHQLNEMRKIYMSLKNEVASIDRRRKKLRRKEREGKAAAAASISSDRRTSDRHNDNTS